MTGVGGSAARLLVEVRVPRVRRACVGASTSSTSPSMITSGMPICCIPRLRALDHLAARAAGRTRCGRRRRSWPFCVGIDERVPDLLRARLDPDLVREAGHLGSPWGRLPFRQFRRRGGRELIARGTSSSAASSISPSETRTRPDASPSGMNESLLATRAILPVEPGVDERRDHALRDAAGAPGLVDDEHAAGRAAPRGAGRRPAAARASAGRRTRAWTPRASSRRATRSDMRRPFAHVTIVRSPPSPWTRAGAERRLARRRGASQPLVALLVQVARVVERDRLEEDADRCRPRARTRGRCAASRRRRRAGRARRSRARGCRAARRPRCRCGSARRSRAGSRARRPARPCRSGSGPARRTAASPPRRAAGPRRCAGRRGTGSPAPAGAR